ncbi:cytochrome P450 [Actinoallomurus bryophytorum]|uniref:Cytochrome P450 n=1 Tax=Actinoallomurus bryophytorum TaxID=1490222 RepID=A0A543CP71_9ACTN|nr:cytochrome P450 [Actinoallomurus bryophytorum]TQL98770.1 cytochrome P450 [Actinoallomurus bryophytorum]
METEATGHEPLVLDPTARRRAAEEKILHAAEGPVLVDILGERAWAVADPDLLSRLLADRRVSKDPRQHWPRFIEGEIVGKWPLYLQVSVDNMFTAYGKAHRRLRRLVSSAFIARRLEALIPSVERNTADLLDGLADAEGTVDLRAAYAVQLPVRVISDLLGIPHEMRARFKETIDRIWNTTATLEEAIAATGDVYAMLDELVRIKRAQPADDMTSTLIATRDDESGGTALTERELIDTLLLVTAAGYETTVNLIDSAITALLADPAQLAHVREGRATWDDVVEETLRFAAPVSHMPMRYAVEDIAVPGGTIREGEAILPAFGAASNHPKHQGESAGRFDVTRADKSHLAFGHGVHFCLGAPLARAEGATAVGGLFARFPSVRLAVPAAELEPVSSILGNGHVALPVHLFGRDRDLGPVSK